MADIKNALQQAKDALDGALAEKRRSQEMMRNLGPAVVDALTPVLREIAANTKLSKEELLSAVSQITVNVPKADIPKAQIEVKIPEIRVPEPRVTVNVPEVKMPPFPEVKLPKIIVPKPEVTVNVPPIKIPPLLWPDGDMPIRGWVQLMGVDLQHPLPVQLRDAKGNPLQLFDNLTQIIQGGGGGLSKIVKVSNVLSTVGVVTINPDGSAVYAGSTSLDLATNQGDTDSRTLRVVQAGDSISSVKVTSSALPSGAATSANQDTTNTSLSGIAGNISALAAFVHGDDGIFSPDSSKVMPMGAFADEAATDSVNEGDIGTPRMTLDRKLLTRIVGATDGNRLDINAAGAAQVNIASADGHVDVLQVSGSIDSVYITGSSGSLSASLIDSSGIQYSGSNPLPVVFGASATSAVNIVDSTGVAYESNNPLPVAIVSGGTATSASALVDSTGVQYSGSNPLPTTGTSTLDAATNQGDTDARTLRVIHAGDSGVSVHAIDGHFDTLQLSGSIDSVYVTGASGTISANIVDSGGVAYTTSNPLPVGDAGGSLTIDGSVTVSDVTNSVKATIIDSTGVGYSGSNPVPVTGTVIVGSSTNTTGASIIDSSGVQYSGSNPLPIVGPVVVTSITNTTAANIVDSTGVAYETANPLPITWVSGAGATVGAANIDSTGVQYSGSNPFPVTVAGATATTGANIVDSTGVAYSGSNPVPVTGTVVVSSVTASTAASIVDSTGVPFEGANPFPITIITSATASVNAALTDSGGVQYSGSNPVPITWVSGAGATVGAANIDSTGVQYSGSNPMPIYVAGTASSSVGASLVDSTGVQYSGSNPLPITGNVNVNGSLNSVLATGVTLHDAVDDGDAPLKVGGVAVQANPTAVAGGDRVRFTADDLGRQLTRPIQVRDLILTAYVTLATGASFGVETTLLAGTAGEYHDLIYVLGANTSDAALQLDFRQVSAGNVVFTLEIPSGGTAGVSLPVPIPQSDTGNNWTVDAPDISGTTAYVSALFTKEV